MTNNGGVLRNMNLVLWHNKCTYNTEVNFKIAERLLKDIQFKAMYTSLNNSLVLCKYLLILCV